MDEVLLPLLGGKLENLGQVTKVKPYGMIPTHDTRDSSWLFSQSSSSMVDIVTMLLWYVFIITHHSIGYLMNLPTPKQENVSENTHVSPVISTVCWCYPANFQPRHQQFHACCIESAPLCSSKCHKPGQNTDYPGKVCNRPRFFSDLVGFLDDVGTSVSSCVKMFQMFESTHVTIQ